MLIFFYIMDVDYKMYIAQQNDFKKKKVEIPIS